MKIPALGTDLFHADGRTDMTKLLVAFRNFANAPKNCLFALLAYITENSCLNPVTTATRAFLTQALAQELYIQGFS
jgi:hypothetical protein